MEDKAALRTRLREARARRDPVELTQAAAEIAQVGLAHCGGHAVVAAYASVRDEPPTRELLDLLTEHGATVLLPVVHGDELAWARYAGWPALAERNGLLEPAGDPAGATALTDAGVILAPALAVDRHGHRLGRGRGYYDRALTDVPRQRVVAVVFTDEVLDDIPTDAHDIPVSAALTPTGVVELGGTAPA